MKKTLTINLGGLVFNIDEDAFLELKNYLDTIRGYFDHSEGRDEIMTDIESRIAEMLQDKMNAGKQVINSQDISEIIAIMGQPEDYISEEDDEEPQAKSQSTSHARTQPKRKLYRDIDESIFGGVCSGIGHFFGMDAVWVRLLFVIAVFLGFSGILVYLIMWVIMPSAKTPSEKLAMRGEPVTFENIGKTVEEEINNVKKKLDNLEENHFRPDRERIHSIAAQIGNFLTNLFQFAFKAIAKIIGFFFTIVGLLLLLSLLFGTLAPFNNIIFESNDVIVGENLMELSQILFTSGNDFWLSLTGVILTLGIPFLAIFLAGITLLFNSHLPKYTGLALAGAWVFGLVLITFGALTTILDFSKESQVTESVIIPSSPNDTLYLDLIDPQNSFPQAFTSGQAKSFFKLHEDSLIIDAIGMDILPSNSNNVQVETIKSARGNSYEAADTRAKRIAYTHEIDSNSLKIQPFFSIQTNEKWRQQNIHLHIFLPVGQTVFIPKSYMYLLDDVDNYHDAYDREMVDKYWTMTDSGLVSPSYLNHQNEVLESDSL